MAFNKTSRNARGGHDSHPPARLVPAQHGPNIRPSRPAPTPPKAPPKQAHKTLKPPYERVFTDYSAQEILPIFLASAPFLRLSPF